MRKLLFVLIAAFLLAACESTPEQRAEKLIRKYLDKTANEPSSIQDLNIGQLNEVDGKDYAQTMRMRGQKVFGRRKGQYVLISYRGKNDNGALVKTNLIYVMFDYEVTKIVCFDCYDEGTAGI